MWISALLGMALKYVEILWAVRFRLRGPNGWYGGPMVYMERGLSPRWHFLAVLFALCGALAAFGMGNLAQVNTVAESVKTFFSALFGGLSSLAERRVAFATGVLGSRSSSRSPCSAAASGSADLPRCSFRS